MGKLGSVCEGGYISLAMRARTGHSIADHREVRTALSLSLSLGFRLITASVIIGAAWIFRYCVREDSAGHFGVKFCELCKYYLQIFLHYSKAFTGQSNCS